MTPELACAVLSFRDEPGLIDAVRSLLRQSESVEVVVVNSGGGDPAGRLAAAGIDVPVVSHEQRLYPGAVRNIGIELTRAPYVAFLAADCVAEPGWAAGRLREHRAGAEAVASSLVNAFSDSTSAWASVLLLHNRLLDVNAPGKRLLYGLSYKRTLFERYGSFREDLRAGEDTEFNARFRSAATVVMSDDVRTAHRYPTEVSAMLKDAYRRGRLQAAMVGRITGGPHGRPRSVMVAMGGLRSVVRALRCLLRMPAPARARLFRSYPLVVLGGCVYAAGALSASWRPYDGYEAPAPPRRTSQKAEG
jgi:glycosyltransferase involved in cell wall biosynthesis